MPRPEFRELERFFRGEVDVDDYHCGDVDTFTLFVFLGFIDTGKEISWEEARYIVQCFIDNYGGPPGYPIDLADQAFMARSVVKTLVEIGSWPINAPRRISVHEQQDLIFELNALSRVLDENLTAFKELRNYSPELDLRLSEHPENVYMIENLNQKIKKLKSTIENGTLNPLDVEVSLSSAALREFVMKLSGSAGQGFGHAIAWSTVGFLGWTAVSVLQNFGLTVQDLKDALQKAVER